MSGDVIAGRHADRFDRRSDALLVERLGKPQGSGVDAALDEPEGSLPMMDFGQNGGAVAHFADHDSIDQLLAAGLAVGLLDFVADALKRRIRHRDPDAGSTEIGERFDVL
ncbi:MAG TPA: hypothetical protein VMF61_12045, partial [Candidatus Acidoferrales bacterium]|nr:hypothetical protein [Candidatus Acidoferrales bacterium]